MRRLAPFAFAPLLLASVACDSLSDLLDDLDERTVVVDVFATHHGTPDEAGFPEHFSVVEFDTDMGWHVVLADAFVTTSGVTLHGCGGDLHTVEMYWGSLPENLGVDDLDLTGVGGVTVAVGDYCGATVHHGPFVPSDIEGAFEMDNPAAIGSSVFLAGIATRGDQAVPFLWRSEAAFDIEVEFADTPMNFDSDQDAKVTLAKTYDRFFDGIAFDEFDDEVDDLVIDTLRRETRVVQGTQLQP